MMHMLGGKVCKAPSGEYGKTVVDLDTRQHVVCRPCPDKNVCWMSHNDYIETAARRLRDRWPTPPTARWPLLRARSTRLYCRAVPPRGPAHRRTAPQMLHNFVYNVCGCAGDLEDGLLRGEQHRGPARERSATARCCCALSGGVDSSVLRCYAGTRPSASS